MNVLIVGQGKGSWAIRGHQLGQAMGARVVTLPVDADLQWADVVVLVKRAGLQWARMVQRYRRPIVWDALDCWSQPRDNGVSEAQAQQILLRQRAFIKPMLTIGATAAMAAAASGVYLPHHAWAGLTPAPLRLDVRAVAYEGNPAYLGRWLPALTEACTRRGWHFLVNPPELRQADILVAFRDAAWDGWICRQWKSGVKYVNARAVGRPILTQDSAAWREINPAGTVVETVAALPAALDAWTSYDARQTASRPWSLDPHRYTHERIAADYLALIERALVEERMAPCTT